MGIDMRALVIGAIAGFIAGAILYLIYRSGD